MSCCCIWISKLSHLHLSAIKLIQISDHKMVTLLLPRISFPITCLHRDICKLHHCMSKSTEALVHGFSPINRALNILLLIDRMKYQD